MSILLCFALLLAQIYNAKDAADKGSKATHQALLPDVKISDAVIEAYNSLHLYIQSERNEGDPRPVHEVGDLSEIPRYLIFIIRDEILIDKAVMCNTTSDADEISKFTKALTTSTKRDTKDLEPRFGIINYKGKVFFIYWDPAGAKKEEKDRYVSVMDHFKSALPGIDFVMNAKTGNDLVQQQFDTKIKLSSKEEALANEFETKVVIEHIRSIPESQIWKKIWLCGGAFLALALIYRAYANVLEPESSDKYMPLFNKTSMTTPPL